MWRAWALVLGLWACGEDTGFDTESVETSTESESSSESASDSSSDSGVTQACPDPAKKAAPGVCGCDLPDRDYNLDGTPDCVAQGGRAPTPITGFRLAVMRIAFADTDPAIRALFPSNSTLASTLFDDQGRMGTYLRDMSFGVFTDLSGDVFGPFTHPRTLQDMVDSGDYADPDFARDVLVNTGSVIQIPGFDASNYDAVVFLAENDYSWHPGGLTGDWTFRINDQDYTGMGIVEALSIGREQRDPSYDLQNTFTQKVVGSVFVPLTDDPLGEMEVPQAGHQLTRFERTFLHELVHAMGVFTHANSSMGDSARAHPDQPEDEAHEDYGDVHSLMGRSEYAVSMCTAYRDKLGWFESSRQTEIKVPGTHEVDLVPTNAASGIRSAEIRIPHKVSEYHDTPGEYRPNEGYFLEVRDPAWSWDSGLTMPQIAENANGVLVYFSDGYTAWLLDTTPSPFLRYQWGAVPDKRDIALKVGARLTTDDVVIEVVRALPGGGYRLSIELMDNW